MCQDRRMLLRSAGPRGAPSSKQGRCRRSRQATLRSTKTRYPRSKTRYPRRSAVHAFRILQPTIEAAHPTIAERSIRNGVTSPSKFNHFWLFPKIIANPTFVGCTWIERKCSFHSTRKSSSQRPCNRSSPIDLAESRVEMKTVNSVHPRLGAGQNL